MTAPTEPLIKSVQKDNQRKGKIEVLLKLAESLVTPLTVALVGFIGSQYLAERERAETDFRFYTELMSRREESDSALRKEMFNSVLTNFLKPVDERPPEEAVLNLELLAYNFHDSLDLAPLFKEVYNQIYSRNLKKDDKDRLLARLDSVTSRVKEKQISTLEESGAKLDATISFQSLKEENTQIIEGGEVLNKSYSPKPLKIEEQVSKEQRAKIELLEIDRNRREVMVRLIVNSSSRVETVFRIGYFDFPMLNNVRLPDSNRCAVVLRDFQSDSAEFVFVFFPASRASLKDKPYYDELTSYLQSKRNNLRER
jgi:hypothetical protein